MTFDHVIRWQIKNVIMHNASITKSTITKRDGNTYQNETLPYLHVTWCNHVITWYASFKIGGNAYQNERVPVLHFTWPNHTKVIKATAPKVVLVKGTQSQDKWSLIMWIPDKWRASNYKFYKNLKALNLKDKKTNKMYLFSGFKDYMIKAVPEIS